MKTLSILFSFVLITSSVTTFAQTQKETFAVSGECGMCKKKIETAAKAAGATYAVWNMESKKLTVKYNSESSNAAKIQQAVANTGYDTPSAKASDAAYNSLHECCQYERTTAKAENTCCAGGDCCANDTCADKNCCKDGSCTHETAHQAKAGNSCCAKQKSF
jgi:hypothetical protein